MGQRRLEISLSKNEFLYILRQSLEGEIDSSAIEQNLRYYDQYIGVHPADEEKRILDELGDPRLIAKTIIEADRAAKQKENNTGNHSYQDTSSYGRDEFRDGYNDSAYNKNYNNHKVFFKNKWYHKLFFAFILIVILMIMSVLGSILFRFIFTLGFPILLIVLLVILFRRN